MSFFDCGTSSPEHLFARQRFTGSCTPWRRQVSSKGWSQSYGCRIKPVEHKRARIGFAAQTGQTSFALTVSESVQRAASEHDIDLVMVDNKYSPKIALRNADHLIRERVEIVLEFQTYENIAPIIAARFIEARIPVIAIEIPHPGAVFFGANNYQAGLIGGRALGRWAKQHWDGRFDEVLLLEEKIAGPLPRLRLSGMLAGLREVLPGTERAIVTTYDAHGSFTHSQHAVREHLRKVAPRRTLVAAGNDPAALGALKAFDGRASCTTAPSWARTPSRKRATNCAVRDRDWWERLRTSRSARRRTDPPRTVYHRRQTDPTGTLCEAPACYLRQRGYHLYARAARGSYHRNPLLSARAPESGAFRSAEAVFRLGVIFSVAYW